MASLENLGDGRWMVRASFGLDDNGRQVRRSRTFEAATPTQAKRIAARVEAELRAEHAAKKTTREHQTLAEAAERWWEVFLSRDRAPGTRQDYRTVVDVHIIPSQLGKRKVRELTVGEFDRWYASLTRQTVRQHGEVKGRTLSAQRVRRVHTVTKLILDQCVRDGVLDRNPAQLAYRPDISRTRKAFAPTDQLRQIVAAARKGSPVAARAIQFTALTGLRRGEVAGVRWAHLDVTNGVMIVQRNVVPVEQRFIEPDKWADKWDSLEARRLVMHEKDPKAHAVVAITLNDETLDVIGEQMAWQRSEAAYAGTGIADGPFLWSVTPPFGEPLWSTQLSRWMRRYAGEAGVEGVSFHDLRHWQASVMLAAGATVADVQARLRHENLQTTLQYLHADLAVQRSFSDRLPSLGPGLSAAHEVDDQDERP